MKRIIGLLTIVMLFLSGCSSKFAYNNMDWMLYWYLDDYIELNKQQKSVFDQSLQGWLSWHRAEELQAYKAHLEQLKIQVNQPDMTSGQVSVQLDMGRAHWLRFRDKIVPELAPMASQLTDEQVEYLFDALEKDNAKEEKERRELSEQENLEQRNEDMQENLKRWIGKLNDEQKNLINTYTPLFLSNFDNWLQYRRNIQGAAKQLMADRQADDFGQKLIYLMLNPQDYQSQEYLAISQHNRKLYAEFLTEVHPTLTSKQQQKLNREIQDLIDDLDDLIED